MGRAINNENRLDDHERRIELIEDALEEMVQTRVHHVDLTDERNIAAEGVEIKPDEEYTAPVSKRKKTKTEICGKIQHFFRYRTCKWYCNNAYRISCTGCGRER